MKTSPELLYGAGARAWQDRFDTRRLADRIEQTLLRDALGDDQRAFVERATMFFLASADADGRPDVSYKGGKPGFVRVLDARTLAFPSYDGNGMFLSLGNVAVNPSVALLFIDFEQPRRLRVHGRASVDPGDALLASFVGAQLVVRIAVARVFPNCPRYLHKLQLVEASAYAPAPGHHPPPAAWKQAPAFRDVLPAGDTPTAET